MAGRKIIINGSLGPVGRPASVDSDPVRGLVVNESFHGAGLQSLAGKAAAYMAHGVAFSWHLSPVVSTIQATYSGGQLGMPDDAAINWQLLGNDVQESIFKNPFVLQNCNDFPTLSDDVRQWRSLWDQGDTDGANAFINTAIAAVPGEEGALRAIIQMIKNGETHFGVAGYVLKRTHSISNFFSGTIPGDAAAEKLLTTATILGFGLPGPLIAKIGSIAAPPFSAPYDWTWRQLPSQLVTSARNRVEVSTEWQLGLWNTNLYAYA